MAVLLTIGEFSKMTYLSVKALRHYHDVGLLEPAEIDAASGYRRYRADQVPTAQAIRRFRELDMPIDQVRVVLEAPDPATRNQAILDHLAAMQEQLERTQQTVASLQSLLSTPVAARPVEYRTLPASSTLAIVDRIRFEDSQWLDAAFAELHATLDTAGVGAVAPDGALYSEAFFTEGMGEVVAFVPVSSAASVERRTRSGPRPPQHPRRGDAARRSVRGSRPHVRGTGHRGGRARARSRGSDPGDLPVRRARRGVLAAQRRGLTLPRQEGPRWTS